MPPPQAEQESPRAPVCPIAQTQLSVCCLRWLYCTRSAAFFWAMCVCFMVAGTDAACTIIDKSDGSSYQSFTFGENTASEKCAIVEASYPTGNGDLQGGNTFQSSGLQTMTIEYASASVALGSKAFAGLSVTVIRECATGCDASAPTFGCSADSNFNPTGCTCGGTSVGPRTIATNGQGPGKDATSVNYEACCGGSCPSGSATVPPSPPPPSPPPPSPSPPPPSPLPPPPSPPPPSPPSLSPPPLSPSPPPPPFAPKQFTVQLVVDVDDITDGPSPENITVGQLIESMASLPNSTEATIEVTVTQNWKVEFEEGGVDAGGVNAFNKLLTACQVLYPSCTGKIVPITSRLRRALGSTQTAVFTRPLSNSSEPITMIPQLVAENVTVETSTFVSATAALSVTALGGAADADALSDGPLSPGAVASAMSDALGVDEDTLVVFDTQPIFPPMPPPSLPPSPPPSPPLPPSPPSPSPPPPSPSAPEDECAGLEDKKCKIKKCEDSKKKLKKCKKQCKKKKLKKKCKKTCCDAGF